MGGLPLLFLLLLSPPYLLVLSLLLLPLLAVGLVSILNGGWRGIGASFCCVEGTKRFPLLSLAYPREGQGESIEVVRLVRGRGQGGGGRGEENEDKGGEEEETDSAGMQSQLGLKHVLESRARLGALHAKQRGLAGVAWRTGGAGVSIRQSSLSVRPRRAEVPSLLSAP